MQVTLIDGREVDSYSEEWRLECFQRWNHVQAMQRLQTRQDRAEYLSRVEQSEGAEAAKRVKADFLTWWEKR